MQGPGHVEYWGFGVHCCDHLRVVLVSTSASNRAFKTLGCAYG